MADNEPSVASDAEARTLLIEQVERLRAEKDRSDVAREQVERHLHQMKEDMAHLRDAITSLGASLVEAKAEIIYLDQYIEYGHGNDERPCRFLDLCDDPEYPGCGKDYFRVKARAALGSSDSHPGACHCGRCAEKPAGPYPEPGGREPGKAAPQSPDVQTKYEELLLAVGNKHPVESRHETALRYIREAEATQEGEDAES